MKIFLRIALCSTAMACNQFDGWNIINPYGFTTCTYFPVSNPVYLRREMFENQNQALKVVINLLGETLEPPIDFPSSVVKFPVEIQNGIIASSDTLVELPFFLNVTFYNITFETCSMAYNPETLNEQYDINIKNCTIDTKNKLCMDSTQIVSDGWITATSVQSIPSITIDNLIVKNSIGGPGTWEFEFQPPQVFMQTINNVPLMSCGLPAHFEQYAQILPINNNFTAILGNNSINENYNNSLLKQEVKPFADGVTAVFNMYRNQPIGFATSYPASPPPNFITEDKPCNASLELAGWTLTNQSICEYSYTGTNDTVFIGTNTYDGYVTLEQFDTLIFNLNGKKAQMYTYGLPKQKITLKNGILEEYFYTGFEGIETKFLFQNVTFDNIIGLHVEIHFVKFDNVTIKSDCYPAFGFPVNAIAHFNNVTTNVNATNTCTWQRTLPRVNPFDYATTTINGIPVISCTPSPYLEIQNLIDARNQYTLFITGNNYNNNVTSTLTTTVYQANAYTFNTSADGFPYRLQSTKLNEEIDVDISTMQIVPDRPVLNSTVATATPKSTWAALGFGIAALVVV